MISPLSTKCRINSSNNNCDTRFECKEGKSNYSEFVRDDYVKSLDVLL